MQIVQGMCQHMGLHNILPLIDYDYSSLITEHPHLRCSLYCSVQYCAELLAFHVMFIHCFNCHILK